MPVAPTTGAWIETDHVHPNATGYASLPPRERGLKHEVVTAHADLSAQSLPPRERGLKLGVCVTDLATPTSLPPRERGLKLNTQGAALETLMVAPTTGAWIETLPVRSR